MFLTLTADHDWRSYDFVIVGAGLAGLFLAERLAKSAKVLVVEAGGTDNPRDPGKGLYEIETTGLYMERIGSRLFSFGGTSNHWDGQSQALSPAVFDNRAGVAGWPISYQDFSSHLEEARAWLGHPPPESDTQKSSLEHGVLADHRDLHARRFNRPKMPLRLGDTDAVSRFAGMANVDVLSMARVRDIVLDEDGSGVASIEVLDRRTGERHDLPVKSLLLCAGGIENARLMLWAGRKYPDGNPLAGGPDRLTGRYFMEHPVLSPLEIFLDARADLTSGIIGLMPNFRSAWVPSDDFLERHELLRFGVFIHTPSRTIEDEHSLKESDAYYLGRCSSYCMVQPNFLFEQTPYAGSFVGLSNRYDAYGDPLARVHWQISGSDLANYRKGCALFGGLLSQAGLARSRFRGDDRGENWDLIEIGRSFHHLGTTRMGHSPSVGVVDTNCRVFGLKNLYVAGTSVFCNGDFVNPTWSMIALAARLAHHIEKKPLSTVRTLHFEDLLLTSGWSHLEESGVWTDGKRAELVLHTGGARHLRLAGRHYADVMITVLANDVILYSGPGHLLRNETLTLDGADKQTIVFMFDNLCSPKERGENSDDRRLGWFLRWLELR
jgi:choline dehydrogenase-like flavoprotein